VDAKRIAAGAVRGVVAGVAGTAAMTAHQLLVGRHRGRPLRTPVPRTWAEAPAPAQVAKRLLGRRVTKQQVPLLTNVMHWGYGVSWGIPYGVVRAARGGREIPSGAALGAAVWALSYAQLVPLGIYEPPWRYPPRELALDLSYHLVYGFGVAGAYAALDR
jgi:hypothetical protein